MTSTGNQSWVALMEGQWFTHRATAARQEKPLLHYATAARRKNRLIRNMK